MPTGIIATVDNGFATIDFVDQSLRGPALAELVEIGGAATIETITRDGPRRKYRVPVGNAQVAGLLDGDEVGDVWSAGRDTGAAVALNAADPNVNPGADNADWHTPVDQYTSANKYVGQVPNATVLHNRAQVFTGDASSYGGSAKAATSRELIDYVKADGQAVAPEGFAAGGGEGDPELMMRAGTFNAALGTQPGALADDPGAVQAAPESAAGVSASLGDQDSALATDPGATPDVGGSVVAEDYTTVQSTRAAAYPEGEPNADWKRPELDAYATEKGLNPADYGNKADLLNAINAKGN